MIGVNCKNLGLAFDPVSLERFHAHLKPAKLPLPSFSPPSLYTHTHIYTHTIGLYVLPRLYYDADIASAYYKLIDNGYIG